MKRILSFILFILLILNLIGCSAKELTKKSYVEIPEEDRKYSFALDAFDTTCAITLYGDNMKENGNYFAEQFSTTIKTFDKTFSKTKEGSDIYRINNRTGNEVMVNDLTATIFDIAKGMYSWSDGRFDISSGTLIDLWDAKHRKSVPSLSEINDARKHCNNLNYDIERDDDSDELNCNKITFHGDNLTNYDVGALIKGYCCDTLKNMVNNEDEIDAAIFNLGGNVCCVGEVNSRKDGAFNVGIFKPFAGTEIIDTVKVKNRCVITSGNYERYFTVPGDDTIYHHIIDPKTGYPTNNELNSVTIISENGLLGDYLSTACFLLGKEYSKQLIDFCRKQFGDKEIQAIFVDKNNNVSKYPEKAKTY